ncbi:double PHD fingers 1 [Rhinolophus ferrumequinum]|uniref:Double PHD fingers 1 n=1 Tax=Rhinolophus ferrumequinum TaxID=59479 RepID=A0A7J7SHK8_RHIFE|nr:double PHD fingers 1 [Rhinolophus ferrumequinum]
MATAIQNPLKSRGLLPRGHRALPQLQRAPVRRAQPAPAFPRLADWRGPEQLLHLDGEDPPRARFGSRTDLHIPCPLLEKETATQHSGGPQTPALRVQDRL